MNHWSKPQESPNTSSSFWAMPPWAMGLLVVTIGAALWLRVWGIGFGLPYDLTYDEPHEILRALKLGAGEYHWGAGGKGGLYYLLFLEYGVLYVVWWLMGWVSGVQEFALLLFQDPSALYLTGRLTVALLGTLTCLVIFLIGQRVYDWRVGLGAAFIGATAYQHALHSHIINVDIGMTLALWASILAYLKYEEKKEEEKQHGRWLIGAGVLAGIAIAHKRPGAIVLVPLLLAIGFPSEKWRYPRCVVKEMAVLLSITLATLTLVAPEWTSGIREFSRKPNDPLVTAGPADWIAHLKTLLQGQNIFLSLSAVVGAGFGVLHRNRWDIIWVLLISVFLGVMTAADPHLQPEYYLLPIMPALWLLSGQALVTITNRRQWLTAPAFACVVAVSLFALVQQNHEWTKPDTRVVAKEWIEENIPPGAKILMDGMRYRFVQSPPLKPSISAISRQAARTGQKRVSRGVSGQQLISLYAQAAAQARGPTYDLRSTVWGKEVQDLTYYIQECFAYIITSSSITRRYTHQAAQERYPQSAQFYRQLPTDPRLQKVYAVEPVPWERGGPTITVYKVEPVCGAASRSHP